MSADSLWRIQSGLYSHLGNDAALTSQLADASASIFDHVPANTAFPYITITDCAARPFDTQQYAGIEAIITIDSFSRAAGSQALRQITAALHDALHNKDFEIDGHTLLLCQAQDTLITQDTDGETYMGRQRFRLLVDTNADA